MPRTPGNHQPTYSEEPRDPGGAGRHRRRGGLFGAPGRAALLGILASLIVLLGSGVALSLTSSGADRPGPEPEVVGALGTAPTPTPEPDSSPTPSAEPSPSAPPTSEPPPPPPPPEPPAPPEPEEEAGSDEFTSLEDEVTSLTNSQRDAAGCPAVSTDERLRTAARGHSQDMAVNDYFSHTSQDGSSPSDRMRAAGYPAPAGENIAFGYRTPAEVMDGWMNSDGHRDNLLNCSHTAIGVGLAYDPNGRPYWTQVFGR